MGNGKATTEHINKTMNEQVATSKPLAKEDEIKKEFYSKDTLRYIKNDTYIADPTPILGRIFYETIDSDKLNPHLLSVESKVDELSILKSPKTRYEMIVNFKTLASTNILSLLSLNAQGEEVYELRVIDNAAARLIDRGSEWETALEKWMNNKFNQGLLSNPSIGSIGVVTGVVQKYITTKKFKKFEAGVKGNYVGVNVEGALYTGSSEFSLDIVYGVDLIYIPKVVSLKQFETNIKKNILIDDTKELTRLNNSFSKLAISQKNILDIDFVKRSADKLY